MKSIYKYIIIFFVIYAFVNFGSIMVIYSWTAFGGTNSMNFAQKAIYFFFRFPCNYLKIDNPLLSILINGIFWSFCFWLSIKIYRKIKS